MTQVRLGTALTSQGDLSDLFRAWLAGDDLLGSATAELQAFLSRGTTAADAAPIWQDEGWREPWLAGLLTDLPAAAHERCRQSVAALAGGQAQVVITGQQPGFLGGPLYTLYKAAAVIAAARLRSACGYPTVPLFWLGDDDDDRREAFAPWLYDPRRNVFLHGIVPEGLSDQMLGTAPARLFGGGEAAWLMEQKDRHGLTAELAGLWQQGMVEDWSWGRLHRRALLRVFGQGELLLISGNDAQLHRAAAPLTMRIWAEQTTVASLATEGGQQLVEAGFHAQIGPSSLERIFHEERAGRRLSLPSTAELPTAERLRPGVAVRSVVQDWLFRPAGVVVGPAELAYLKQLTSLYEALQVPRSSLLPRLFGRVVPQKVASGGEQLEPVADQTGQDVQGAAKRIGTLLTRELATALRKEAGIENERARQLAQNQAGRWFKAIRRLLDREMQRDESGAPGQPIWTRAASSHSGVRQERSLAAYWAAALWGDDFLRTLEASADRYYQEGQKGRWQEILLAVADV